MVVAIILWYLIIYSKKWLCTISLFWIRPWPWVLPFPHLFLPVFFHFNLETPFNTSCTADPVVVHSFVFCFSWPISSNLSQSARFLLRNLPLTIRKVLYLYLKSYSYIYIYSICSKLHFFSNFWNLAIKSQWEGRYVWLFEAILPLRTGMVMSFSICGQYSVIIFLNKASTFLYQLLRKLPSWVFCLTCW